MDTSHKDAVNGVGVQIDKNGVSISMESDDNESTAAEHEQLLPASTTSTSAQQQQQHQQQQPIIQTGAASTSINMEDIGGNASLGRNSGSSASRGGNTIFSSILGRPRFYRPSSTGNSSSSTQSVNRRLQTSRSVGSSGSASIEEATAGANSGGVVAPTQVRPLGFWGVNFNEVLSLSTAPSTEAVLSFITHSNFRYPTASGGSQPATNDNSHILINNQAGSTENGNSNGSNTLRLSNRATSSANAPAIGRSISLREGEMQAVQTAPTQHMTTSLGGLPTAASSALNPATYDDNAPAMNTIQARSGGDGAGGSGAANGQQHQPPLHEHNVDDEHVISEMVVQILSHFMRYLPMLCILLLKFLHDHLRGILDLVLLQYVMCFVNRSLRMQVARLAQKNYTVLVRDACILVAILFARLHLATTSPDPFGMIVPPPKNLFTVDVSPMPYKSENSNLMTDTLPKLNQSNHLAASVTIKSETFVDITNDTFNVFKVIPLGMMLYYAAVSDLIIKLLTILVKVIITMLPMYIIRLKVRARLYVLIEYLSQLYRALTPITQWLKFFYEPYSGLEAISGGIFSSLYLSIKIFELLERGKSLMKAIITFRRNIDSERQPTKDELDAAGAVCPICHDSYNTPVILECGHIFCDDCVNTWFKREQTCPMCRAKVSDDPQWQDGSTNFFLQLF